MATDSLTISKNAEATSFWQGAVVVLGRFLFALIFLMAGANHFNKHLVGLSRKTGRLAHCAFPGPCQLDDA
jgi:uncharacterized membrane protein YphA (DoxX/SURF4 family)